MEKNRILVVEDTAIIGLEIKMKLERFGYEVLGPVASGEEALHIVANEKLDLVLMDIILAGETDGIQTAEKLMELYKFPVLYLTGHTDHKKTERAKRTKPLGYIIKPYEDSQLRTTVEMAIEKLKADKELEKYKTKLEKLVEERTIDLEKAKLKAEESNRLKTAFLSNLSHEIRTPLNSIIGFSSLITQQESNEETKEQYVTHIENNAEDLMNLIENIIESAKIETGQIRYNRQICNLDYIFDKFKPLYEKKIKDSKKNNLNFILDKNGTDSFIFYSDCHFIQKIISHLSDNALKFTEQGTITIGYQIDKTKNSILLFVKDTGIGIDNDNQSVIFDSFRKLENNKSKLYAGAGLGLSIVKGYVSSLGGNIIINSHKNKGTDFHIELPSLPMDKQTFDEFITN